MELKIWVTALFSVYRCLNKLASSIDKFVQMKAISSYYNNLSTTTFCGAEKVTSDLAELIDKKTCLINIKLVTEKILKKLPDKYARYIILKYIDNLENQKIAKIMGVSERTISRRHIDAIEKSGKVLAMLGFNENSLMNIVKKEKWFLEVLNHCKNDYVIKHRSIIEKHYIYNLACKEYKLLAY